MYTVINNDYVGFDGNSFTRRVDIVCDTSADLPSAEQIADFGYSAGSWAWIANERTYKTLNNAGEWV